MKLKNATIEEGTPFSVIANIKIDVGSIALKNVGTDGDVEFVGTGVTDDGFKVRLAWDVDKLALDNQSIAGDFESCADWLTPSKIKFS